MRMSWLTMDLTNLPKYFFFLVLLVFPFFSYIVDTSTSISSSRLFGLICISFLIFRLFTIYKSGRNLKLPTYVILFGIFTTYTILSNIFISDKLMEEGPLNYFYSNSLLFTFVAFLIVENTDFSKKWIVLGAKVLGVVLLLAAIVSVIQIFSPFFFTDTDFLSEGLSYERLADYYSANDNPSDLTGSTSRFLKGYRKSIYSYIGPISVGIDNLAILSVLLAMKSSKWVKTTLWVVAAALTSFLSSSRWIILNFFVITSQNVWFNKNIALNALKYVVYCVALVIILVPLLQFSGIDIQKFVEERLLSNSANTRLLAFEVFSKVYFDNPILGTGGEDTVRMTRLLGGHSSQIHVGYLKLFYYYGLIGGLLFLAFLGSLLSRLWRIGKQCGYWGGFFAFLAFAIANLTLVKFDLFYCGLLLALIYTNHFYHNSILIMSKKEKGIKKSATDNELRMLNL